MGSLRLPSRIKTVDEYFDYIRKIWPARDGYSWESRVSRWDAQGIELYDPNLTITTLKRRLVMPLFPQMWAQATENSINNTKMWERAKQVKMLEKTIEEKPMLEKAKSTVTTVIDQNKEAGLLAAELSVGRSANEFIRAKLIRTLPWYKRWFVGKEGTSWLGKLIVAQTVNALVQQTSSNDKLQRIAEAMLKESVVESTVYSDQLTNIIQGLEEAVSLPHLDKLMGKDTK